MSVRVLVGDVRAKLAELADESVHCVVTSPPYFGLRDYGTAAWEGGDAVCDHVVASKMTPRERVQHKTYRPPSGWTNRDATPDARLTCKCGARRIDSQIGLEETPAAYVATMVDVFREVRRVLRNDGTVWCNLGDSYASTTSATGARGGSFASERAQWQGEATRKPIPDGLKPKDLIGIPWRVAFALQADGWYLRQDIIWAKPNPMPESVTDRCTKAHEYLFLLSKSARYFYDADAIKEESSASDESKARYAYGRYEGDGSAMRHERTGKPDFLTKHGNHFGPETRNRRSVWTVATQPYSEAHFATFPPALIEPCIMAGCPKDCCAKCGAPVVRIVKREANGGWDAKYADEFNEWTLRQGGIRGKRVDGADKPARIISTNWSPSCSCDAGLARGVVLDPFFGAGTTGLVADRLGRDAIGVELNPEYAELACARMVDDGPLFADIALSPAAHVSGADAPLFAGAA